MTFTESCTQPVRSNALQEAVGHGHSDLQISRHNWRYSYSEFANSNPFCRVLIHVSSGTWSV